MAPDREHLDGVEAVRGDLDEMIAVEPIADIEMRRDAKHKCRVQNQSAETYSQGSSKPRKRSNRGYFARLAFT